MPLVEKIAPSVPSLKKIIVLTDAAHMPESALPNIIAYEEGWPRPTAISPGRASTKRRRPVRRHRAQRATPRACSTATARPRVLHAMIACMPDAMGIPSRDVILPVVPMFHANAWGLGQSGADDRRQDGYARRQDGRRSDLRAARHRKGELRPPSPSSARCCCSIWKTPARRCRI